MTVLDFRSGGYADARDGQLSDDAPGHATHWPVSYTHLTLPTSDLV